MSDELPCAKCGYDLRGSVSLICPECGLQNKKIDLSDEKEAEHQHAMSEATLVMGIQIGIVVMMCIAFSFHLDSDVRNGDEPSSTFCFACLAIPFQVFTCVYGLTLLFSMARAKAESRKRYVFMALSPWLFSALVAIALLIILAQFP